MNDSTKKKSMLVAYLLWLPPFGLLGAHRFYLGQRWAAVRLIGVVGLLSSLLYVLLLDGLSEWMISPFGILCLSLLLSIALAWWCSDGFLMYGAISNRNVVKSLAYSNDGVSALYKIDDRQKRRNLKTAYILWLPPLGWFGIHRLYAKRYDSGLAMFILFSSALISIPVELVTVEEGSFLPYIITLYFVPISGILLIWWIVDHFLINDIVEHHNAKLLANSRGEKPTPQQEGSQCIK